MTLETANRLFELRKNHGLSQEELAEKLGVSRQAVSKWERGEASPDTDNLIALAKLYGLSLDELIFGERKESAQSEEPPEESSTEDDAIYIDVEKENKRVKIGPMGIVVNDGDGETVKIGFNGIQINTRDDDDEDFDDEDDDDEDDDDVYVKNGHFHVEIDKPKSKVKFWLEVPYPILCVIAYLIFGCLDILGGWALSWIVFITIPIYYSLVEAIYKRRFSEFAYPVFAVFIYLYIGLYHGIWHPSWIIFLTIPVYSPIAEAIDKKIRARKEKNSTNP